MEYTKIEIEGMKEILKDKEKEINRLNAKIKKLEKELSAVYKAYHTALWIDKEEDLYDSDA